jgi:hypothetical protein
MVEMNFLTYHPSRRTQWTTHNHWPSKAVAYWENGANYYKNTPMRIYTIGENMESMTLIPQDKWKDYEDV